MPTATQTTPATFLESMLECAGLKSQYARYANERIRQGVTFYTDIRQSSGERAAEAALSQWNRTHRRSHFAATIDPVAQGLLALARTGGSSENVKFVEIREGGCFPEYEIDGPSQMVVFLNRDGFSLGREPAAAEVFGPNGRLGLSAVTLQAGHSQGHRGIVAQLGLVIYHRDSSEQNREEATAALLHPGYTVVTVDLDGKADAISYGLFVHSQAYLAYTLGIADLNRALCPMRSTGRNLDDSVGFSGATDYLADNLPKLGTYLADLASLL